MDTTLRNDNAMRGHGKVAKTRSNQWSDSSTLWQRYEQLKSEISERATSAEEYSEAVRRLAAAMGV